MCAERTAIFHAVNSGSRCFRAVVVTTDVPECSVYPCGACLQVLSEFGNFDVYCLRPDGGISRNTLNELMPYVFSSAQLVKGKTKSEKEA